MPSAPFWPMATGCNKEENRTKRPIACASNDRRQRNQEEQELKETSRTWKWNSQRRTKMSEARTSRKQPQMSEKRITTKQPLTVTKQSRMEKMEMELTTEKEDERSQKKPQMSEDRITTKQPLTVTKQSRMEKKNNQHPGSRDMGDNYAPRLTLEIMTHRRTK